RGETAMANLPEDVRAWIDAFDPDRTARAILPFFGTAVELAGRRVWGARDPRWLRLENKTVIDELWDRLGIAHAPARVVRLAEIEEAHTAIDRGEGTVIAA